MTFTRRGTTGELAQMVERSLSMREVRGSMPRFSTYAFLLKVLWALFKD